ARWAITKNYFFSDYVVINNMIVFCFQVFHLKWLIAQELPAMKILPPGGNQPVEMRGVYGFYFPITIFDLHPFLPFLCVVSQTHIRISSHNFFLVRSAHEGIRENVHNIFS